MMPTLFWTYCNKCRKAIGIDYYPFNASQNYQDDIDKELALKMSFHQENLCSDCKYKFAFCKGNPEFGDCIGNDNVIGCNS